jgi:hypothetical protein
LLEEDNVLAHTFAAGYVGTMTWFWTPWLNGSRIGEVHMPKSLTIVVGIFALVVALAQASPSTQETPWVTYQGKEGPGLGKHIVLISGDEEYRSEEALPQLGKILANRHGFRCTVLFAIDPRTGEINPNHRSHIPGLQHLESADLAIFFLRFRDLPDEQMAHIDRYLRSGRPVVGLRTSTHAFHLSPQSSFRHYDFRHTGDDWEGGFGRKILGETWIAHHGEHGRESTRGIIAPGAREHPIVRGIRDGDIWGPTDVYRVRLPLSGDSNVLVLGQVLAGMQPDAAPVAGPKNDPMMPIAWVKTYEVEPGKRGRVFTTTMGSSVDFQSEGLRTLVVNAVYWCLGMEGQIAERADVRLVGTYEPTFFGFDRFRRGLRPSDFAD